MDDEKYQKLVSGDKAARIGYIRQFPKEVLVRFIDEVAWLRFTKYKMPVDDAVNYLANSREDEVPTLLEFLETQK